MFWTMQIQLRTSIVWNIRLCKCAFLIEEMFSFEMFTGVPKHRPKLISIHVFLEIEVLPIQVFENRKFPFGQKRFITYMVSQKNAKKSPPKLISFAPKWICVFEFIYFNYFDFKKLTWKSKSKLFSTKNQSIIK